MEDRRQGGKDTSKIYISWDQICDIQNKSGLSKAEMSLSFRVNSASMVALQSQEMSFFCPQPCLPPCPRCGFLLDMVPHCAQQERRKVRRESPPFQDTPGNFTSHFQLDHNVHGQFLLSLQSDTLHSFSELLRLTLDSLLPYPPARRLLYTFNTDKLFCQCCVLSQDPSLSSK